MWAGVWSQISRVVSYNINMTAFVYYYELDEGQRKIWGNENHVIQMIRFIRQH